MKQEAMSDVLLFLGARENISSEVNGRDVFFVH